MGDDIATSHMLLPSPELISLMRDFSRAAILAQPRDLKAFAAKYFAELAAASQSHDEEQNIESGGCDADEGGEALQSELKAAYRFDAEQFFRFKEKLLDVADGALVGKEHIHEVVSDLSLPSSITDQLLRFVEEETRQPDEVVAMAATLAAKEYMATIELIFAAYQSDGRMYCKQLSDMHAAIVALIADEPLQSRFGSAIHNALLSLTFDDDAATISLDEFKRIDAVVMYLNTVAQH